MVGKLRRNFLWSPIIFFWSNRRKGQGALLQKAFTRSDFSRSDDFFRGVRSFRQKIFLENAAVSDCGCPLSDGFCVIGGDDQWWSLQSKSDSFSRRTEEIPLFRISTLLTTYWNAGKSRMVHSDRESSISGGIMLLCTAGPNRKCSEVSVFCFTKKLRKIHHSGEMDYVPEK